MAQRGLKIAEWEELWEKKMSEEFTEIRIQLMESNIEKLKFFVEKLIDQVGYLEEEKEERERQNKL